MPSLLKWIDPENIPRYLGGTSDATLIDDAGPWNDPQIRSEIEEDIAHRDGSMSPLPESPPATSSNRSTPQGAGQVAVSNGNSSFSRGSEAAPFARGSQALGIPATAQRPSPFAAQSQHTPFDADTSQVGHSLVLFAHMFGCILSCPPIEAIFSCGNGRQFGKCCEMLPVF